MHHSLIVKVGAHVMSNRHNKRSDLRKVALIAIIRFKEFELDHVTIVAAREKKNNLKVSSRTVASKDGWMDSQHHSQQSK
jgi:hypothetical protein